MEFPPMQDPASYNLDQVLEQVKKHGDAEQPERVAPVDSMSVRHRGRPRFAADPAWLSDRIAYRRMTMSRTIHALAFALFWVAAASCLLPTGPLRADGPAAVLERRAGEAGDRRVRAGDHDDQGSPKFVPPAGTHRHLRPGRHALGRASDVLPGHLLPGSGPGGGAKQSPNWQDVEPFKTVLSGDREAIAKLPMQDLEKILAATLTGMTVEEFNAEVKKWLATAKDPRWKRPYTELTYLPMQEVLRYLRANGYKTYIVTGGGQDFVRVYSEQTYGIPPEQVVGTRGRNEIRL